MKVNFLFLLSPLLLFFSLSLANQCSDDDNGNFRSVEAEFRTSADVGRSISNILFSNDGSSMYITSRGTTILPSTTYYETTIEKRTGDLEVTWAFAQYYVTNENSMVIDSKEEYLYLSSYGAGNRTIAKISTTTGNLEKLVMVDVALLDCIYLQISPDDTYLYYACTDADGGFILTELTISTFEVSHSIDFANDALLSMSAYTKSESSKNLILTTFHSGNSEINIFSYTFPSNGMNYGLKVGCRTACTTQRGAKTLVLESRDTIAVAYIDDLTTETLLFMSLSSGSYTDNALTQESDAATNRNIMSIGEYGSSDKIFIMSSDSSYSYVFIYDFTTSSATTTFRISTELKVFTSKFGYFAYGSASSDTTTLKKYVLDDTYHTPLALNTSSNILNTPATYPSTAAATITFTTVSSSRTITDVPPNTSTNTNTLTKPITQSPLNYRNASYQTLNIPAGGKNTIDILSPCFAQSVEYGLEGEVVNGQRGEASPSWVELKSDFSAVVVEAPEIVNSESTFYMGIKYTYSSYEYTQFSTINLFYCSISHCNGCSYTTRATKCSQCRSGYILAQDGSKCTEEVLPLEAMAAATTAVVVATTAMSAVSSATTSGSSAMWAVVNQYQLYLLLPILKTYMPSNLVYYLTEFELFNFDLKFLDKLRLPGLEAVIEDLDYTIDEEIFIKNGFSSGSFFVKQFQFFKAIAILGLLNLVFIGVYFCLRTKREQKMPKKIIGWLLPFFYFTSYIRLTIEAFLFAFMSAFLEFTTFDSFTTQPGSYVFALIFTILFLSLPLLIYWHFMKYNNDNQIKDSSKLSEFYEGYKDGRRHKLFTIVFLFRRILSVLCIVGMRNSSISMRCMVFFMIQLFYFQYLLFNRPHDSKKDNLIEVLNETFFVAITLMVVLFQNENEWKPGMAQIVILSVMANGFVIFIIVACDLVQRLCQYLRNKKVHTDRVEVLETPAAKRLEEMKEELKRSPSKVKQVTRRNSIEMDKSQINLNKDMSLSRNENLSIDDQSSAQNTRKGISTPQDNLFYNK